MSQGTELMESRRRREKSAVAEIEIAPRHVSFSRCLRRQLLLTVRRLLVSPSVSASFPRAERTMGQRSVFGEGIALLQTLVLRFLLSVLWAFSQSSSPSFLCVFSQLRNRRRRLYGATPQVAIGSIVEIGITVRRSLCSRGLVSRE